MGRRASLLAVIAVANLLSFAMQDQAIGADVTVSRIFSSNMVLQRDRPVAIWGWADPGQQVTVAFSGQTVTAIALAPDPAADGRGRWTATLQPMAAETTPRDLTITGPNRIVLSNVLVGDVWLCGGQSNMSMSVRGFKGEAIADDIAKADFPTIRHFAVEVVQADAPRADLSGTWKVCTPKDAGSFTAVGFYFARALRREGVEVPIGILRAAKGSTHIECWLSEETFLKTPELSFIGEKMRQSLIAWEAAKVDAANRGVARGSAEWPVYPFNDAVKRPLRCVTHYNGMIAPLAGLSVRGILWYQGESNADGQLAASQYRHLLRALATSWRALLGGQQAGLPFYYVQLPAYTPATDDPAIAQRTAYLREAQRVSLQAIPDSGMAVTIDIGDADDIHPANKDDVGKRLARLALSDVYGWKQGERSGPLFEKMVIEGDQARLFFRNTATGLMVATKAGRAPAVEVPGGELKRFAICGSDRSWKWGRAVIDAATGTVVVSADGISTPVAVRYAFANNPEGANLYNRDGLPASPFCTDEQFPAD